MTVFRTVSMEKFLLGMYRKPDHTDFNYGTTFNSIFVELIQKGFAVPLGEHQHEILPGFGISIVVARLTFRGLLEGYLILERKKNA